MHLHVKHDLLTTVYCASEIFLSIISVTMLPVAIICPLEARSTLFAPVTGNVGAFVALTFDTGRRHVSRQVRRSVLLILIFKSLTGTDAENWPDYRTAFETR